MAQVTFKVHFVTRWGENLGFERRHGDGAAGRAERLPLQHIGNGYWSLWFDSLSPGEVMVYRYLLTDERGGCTREPVFRRVTIAEDSLLVCDEWLPPELPEMAFLRQAFAGVIFNPEQTAVPSQGLESGRKLRATVYAARVPKGCRVCVSGGAPVLGNWDPAGARVMSGQRYPVWEIELPLAEVPNPLDFKFGLWSEREERLVLFEEGPNRQLRDLPADPAAIAYSCAYFRHRWPWKGAGVAIPVFSLRSHAGYGIGEFADLELLAGWAADCRLRMIQVLPVNDTTSDFTWKDSYPYKAISSLALHPIYLRVASLFEAYHLPPPKDYAARREALNRLPQVDYETVLKDKLACLRAIYGQAGARELQTRRFGAFFREHDHWLKPYAAFCRLRDRHATADFSQWGGHAGYGEEKIAAWFEPGAPEYAEVMFHCFVQFHLKLQLDQAIAAGHARGVAFQGDLPIGIDRHSVEAWTDPALFHMNCQTGAPPDPFAVLGQNWGFPTYDWPKMASDGYAWWRRRLRHMSTCFDCLRVDHILGFFRIWEIPDRYTEGIMGHYNPALPLSREEIAAWGFQRDPARFAVPSVTEGNLREFFGESPAKAVDGLLYRDADGFLRIKPEFVTAAARQAWYAAACSAGETARIEDGMRRLGFEVLFLEDPDQPGRFHPRITLQTTRVFASLDGNERGILSELHDDFFHHRHDRFWEEEALKRLPALMDASGMLICGEDLGMIPAAVPGVLKRLGILSLEVQRMPKSPGRLYGQPQEYPYLSVCTTSTHDMATLRGWWEEEAVARQSFYSQVMQWPGEAPAAASPEICRFIVGQHLAGASMWCIPPLQDWLALDGDLRSPVAAQERINVPAIPRHYWRYRMHLSLEQLLQAAEFNQRIARMVADSGRSTAY